jgi:hypothetical protein
MWSKARATISPSLPATGTIRSKGTWASPSIENRQSIRSHETAEGNEEEI